MLYEVLGYINNFESQLSIRNGADVYIRQFFQIFGEYANIIYAVPENIHVKVTIYDLNGRQISVLKNEFQTPGYYSIQWDASQYSSGVYFVEMLSGNFRQIRQVLHMK